MKKSRISFLVVLVLIMSMFTSILPAFAATPEAIRVERYADVQEGHWAFPWVSFMTDKEYIHGYPTNENDGLEVYKPDQNITRAEFVTILYFMLSPQKDMQESFKDLNKDDWYYEYISKAVATGYMSGYGDGTIHPKAYITREEASSIVYRAFKIEKYTQETNFADAEDISAWAYEAIMSLAQIGVVVGYTGEEEDMVTLKPKTNIKRAEVASLLANADKFYPKSVILPERPEATFDEEDGASINITFNPKNTSDQLVVKFDSVPDTDIIVVYNKDGEEKRVTPEELEKEVFTRDQLENADMTFNLPNVKHGDKIKIKVTVTDKEDDEVVGEKEYIFGFDKDQGAVVDPVTPPPSSEGTITGGGTTVQHTVTYMINGNVDSTETVIDGALLQNVPTPADITKSYVWHKDSLGGAIFDVSNTSVTGNMTLYAEEVNRDRVVESLQAYQAMKTKTDKATALHTNIQADTVAALAPNVACDGTNWWTKDMLLIILTNDLNRLGEEGSVTNFTANADRMKIYDDVARYVVDNSTVLNYSGVVISSATKLPYVNYFRAMTETINQALEIAVNEYKLALANNGTAQSAYNAFLVGAATGATSGLQNAIANNGLVMTQAEKDEIVALAVSYVTSIKTNAGELVGIKAELEAFVANNSLAALNADEAAKMIAAKRIYPNA